MTSKICNLVRDLVKIEPGGRGEISKTALFENIVKAVVHPLPLPSQPAHPQPKKIHPAEQNDVTHSAMLLRHKPYLLYFI